MHLFSATLILLSFVHFAVCFREPIELLWADGHMENNWGVFVGFGVYVSAEESIEGLIKMLYSIGKLWGLRILVIQEKETGANEKVGS